jgi:tetratricopeptide (TPR) repeat protein
MALEQLNATEFWNGATIAYEHLAELHLKQQSPESAFDCIEKRIDLARRHGNRHMEAAAWEQKARAYELTDQKDVAMECLRKSFDLQQRKDPYEKIPPSRPTAMKSRQ